MGAALKLPDNIVPFSLPKRRPRIKEKEEIPHQKTFCIVPFRAVSDKRLHEGTLRTLMVLCSYTNRAGITWVGQTTMGKQLGISKQAVSKQMVLLQKLGYIEVMSKGFRGERANTTRVIFDETVSAEDAISVTSSLEDTRPPYIVKQEEREMDEAKRKALVEQATKLSKGFGKINVMKVDTTPRENDSITVREMRANIKQHQEKVKRVAKAKREQLAKDAVELSNQVEKLVIKPVDNSVENMEHRQLHSQPHGQPLGVDQRSDKVIDKVINSKELSNKLNNIFINKVRTVNKLERVLTEEDKKVMLSLVENGLTEEMWIAVLDDTLHSFASQRRDPPHRISWFKDSLMTVLNASLA